MKIDLEQLEFTLAQHDVEMDKRLAIIKDLEQSIEEEKAEKAAAGKKRGKSSYVLIQPGTDKQLLYALKVKKDLDLTTLSNKLLAVRASYNNSKKGQKTPAKSHIDTIELAKGKDFKGEELTLINKEALVIVELKAE